jgi:uncharacterized RDD family membrane protein YckC
VPLAASAEEGAPALPRPLRERPASGRSAGATTDRSDFREANAAAPVSSTLDEAAPMSAFRRVTAAAIDACLLAGIDLAVVHFTLQLTGLDYARIAVLPLVPLVAFLLLLDGGYLIGFTTASGQTIGKMITGIRVTGDTTLRVPLGTAIVRAAAMLLTLLSLGAGYLPILAGRDRRALHDRLAGTRVRPR